MQCKTEQKFGIFILRLLASEAPEHFLLKLKDVAFCILIVKKFKTILKFNLFDQGMA